MIAQELGRRLKNERKAKGFTQKVMAEKMGMGLHNIKCKANKIHFDI